MILFYHVFDILVWLLSRGESAAVTPLKVSVFSGFGWRGPGWNRDATGNYAELPDVDCKSYRWPVDGSQNTALRLLLGCLLLVIWIFSIPNLISPAVFNQNIQHQLLAGTLVWGLIYLFFCPAGTHHQQVNFWKSDLLCTNLCRIGLVEL